MRPRIRDLIENLEAAGFAQRDAKTNRMNYRHPVAGINITLAGEVDDIAKHYIIIDVRNSIYLTDNEGY